MYKVPHDLGNDQENTDILVKSQNWVHAESSTQSL